jgi:predicted flavoprotein YhiN
MQSFDVVVIGAGAAGLFCAGMAGQLGLKVLLIDHGAKVAEKIRISGGGRCNFTNRDAGPANFLSANPHFSRSALARYTPQDFIALVQRHRIPWHEKHKGQLFCDESAEDIIGMLLREYEQGNVTRCSPVAFRPRARLQTDSSSTLIAAPCARGVWSSPPAACPFPRLERLTLATALPSNSATTSSRQGRRWCL